MGYIFKEFNSGMRRVQFEDDWNKMKNVYVSHINLPYASTVVGGLTDGTTATIQFSDGSVETYPVD